MSLYREEILEAWRCALIEADTLAGPNVFVGRTEPLTREALPSLLLWCPDDRGESAGPNAVSFKRTATIAIKALTSAGTEDNTRRIASDLSEQIELSILTNVSAMKMVSEIASMQSTTHVTADGGDHFAEVRYLFDAVYYENFNPSGVPLMQINGEIRTKSNADFADMRVIFQKS